MSPDDERMMAAAERAGVLYAGCDTPDHLADEVVRLRAVLVACCNAQRMGPATEALLDIANAADSFLRADQPKAEWLILIRERARVALQQVNRSGMRS